MDDIMAEDELEPKTTREFLVAIHGGMKDLKVEAKKTNGRVTRLERFMWSVIGGGATTVGLATLAKALGVSIVAAAR